MSSWPLPFLLDELWLKSHRSMVQSLEERGLWIEMEDYKALALQQKRLGESLNQELLFKALGKDYQLLHVESFFGGSHARLQRKLPFSLAFGHELGQAFLYLAHPDAIPNSKVSHATALFNMGISLFDLYLDQGKSTDVQALSNLVNTGILTQLSESKGRRIFQEQCKKIKEEEKRVLSKIIYAFYSCVYEQAVGKKAPQLKKLNTLLSKAYQAEMNSQLNGGSVKIDLKQVAQRKSILPFMIIGEITLAFATPRPTPGSIRTIRDFSKELGTIFWLLDDLTDLVGDFQTGQLNSFFLNGKKTSFQLNEQLINRLLLEEYLEVQVRNLCQAVSHVIEIIYAKGDDSAMNFKLRQTLLFYIRDWMN